MTYLIINFNADGVEYPVRVVAVSTAEDLFRGDRWETFLAPHYRAATVRAALAGLRLPVRISVSWTDYT